MTLTVFSSAALTAMPDGAAGRGGNGGCGGRRPGNCHCDGDDQYDQPTLPVKHFDGLPHHHHRSCCEWYSSGPLAFQCWLCVLSRQLAGMNAEA